MLTTVIYEGMREGRTTQIQEDPQNRNAANNYVPTDNMENTNGTNKGGVLI